MITTLLLLSATSQAAEPVPTATQQTLYDALVKRHDPPTCDQLDSLSTDIVSDLAWLVDHATQPAWVGLRAAQCLLLAHPVESQAVYQRWLSTDGHRGLAILMTQKADQLPLEVATTLTRTALEGPERLEVQRRLADSDTPELRALAAAE